jgi:hypothetical protein
MSTILARPPAGIKRTLSQLMPGENDGTQGVIAWSRFFLWFFKASVLFLPLLTVSGL